MKKAALSDVKDDLSKFCAWRKRWADQTITFAPFSFPSIWLCRRRCWQRRSSWTVLARPFFTLRARTDSQSSPVAATYRVSLPAASLICAAQTFSTEVVTDEGIGT